MNIPPLSFDGIKRLDNTKRYLESSVSHPPVSYSEGGNRKDNTSAYLHPKRSFRHPPEGPRNT